MVTGMILGFLAGLCLGQVSSGGRPYSSDAAKSIAATPLAGVRLPAPDVPALLAEDKLEEARGLPFRFGAPQLVDLDLETAGEWQQLPEGGYLWRLRIECPGAYSINLIYDDFWLPQGARFFIYDLDRTTVLGAFTAANNLAHGKFATAPTRGPACVLEYEEPAGVDRIGRVHVSHVVHGYKDVFFNEKGYGGSGACNVNVVCPDGDDWRDQIRAAGMLLTSYGSRFCSGTLLNNVRGDLTPYFLTANHCWDSSSDTWVVMFNYQSPTCDPQSDGSTTQTVAGTTLRARNADSDFCLVELSSAPPGYYNVYYSGFSAEDVAPISGVAIHHPHGDIKKISHENDPLTSSNYEPSPYLANSHWKVADWDSGTTEQGSSGSGLWNPDKRLVGQLHGGWAACGNNSSDYYGKLSMSWDRGASSGTRLKDWLDPDDTGTRSIDGKNGASGSIYTYDGTLANTDPFSVYRTSSYADTWRFTLASQATVIIELNSSAFDAYLVLYQGTAPSAAGYIAHNDDVVIGNTNSRITIALDAGDYCLETTSYYSNRTGDYSLTSTVELTSGSVVVESYDQFIPAVAHTGGANGTFWLTDVDLLNTGATKASLTVALFKLDQSNLEPETVDIDVLAGQTLRLTDVLGSTFSFWNAGLGFMTGGASVFINSRFYNTASACGGTYGMYIPAVKPGQGIQQSVRRAWFHHLGHSTNDAAGFRTNIGFLNGSAEAVTVEIRLHGDSGEFLASHQHELQPYEHRQFTKIFEMLGTAAVTHGHARVEVLSGNGEVFPYAMLIDNVSGDPVYMNADLESLSK